MARIKISDLPKDMKLSKGEMKEVVGGAFIGVRIPLDQTSPRQTLDKSADIAMTSGRLAASFIPGAAVVSAAISG